MAQRAAEPLLSEDGYLALEQKSEVKHEYFAGEMFAMAGGTLNHSLIASNFNSHLRSLLSGRGCLVFTSDLRVKIVATGLFTYPDVSVVCGPPDLLHQPSDTLVNPTLIVEVLSESTEAYDRGTKFDHYRQIPSLTTYLLVNQDRARIEQFIRHTDFEWRNRVANGLDAVMELPALGVSISPSEIFSDVKFASSSGRSFPI